MARRPGPSSRAGLRSDRLAPEAVTSAHRAPPPASTAPDANLVVLGEFGRPHGLRGEVRLKSYTGDPQAIMGYGSLVASDGRRLEIASARPAPGGAPDLLVVRVTGIDDRTGAEALNRITLSIPRTALGEAEDEDEFFNADLIGLPVFQDGAEIGEIVDVVNYGGGDLLEIRPAAGGPTAFLPFTRAFVPTLDIPNRRVEIVPPDDLFAPPGPKPADDPG